MRLDYCPYDSKLPYWENAYLYKCLQCNIYWLQVDNTELAAIDAALGRDVIPNGLYRWNGADTLPNLLSRKDELWDKRAIMEKKE